MNMECFEGNEATKPSFDLNLHLGFSRLSCERLNRNRDKSLGGNIKFEIVSELPEKKLDHSNFDAICNTCPLPGHRHVQQAADDLVMEG